MKRMRISMSVVLVVVLLVPTLVSAQGSGITWNSGFQVQNLENAEATINIMYYDQTGAEVIPGGVNDTIPALGSKTYYPIPHAIGETFNGSVVISSNTQVVAIANLLASGALSAGAATNSFSAGAMTMSLPLIARGNAGFNTWFNVQNTGTSSTNVTVTYNPGSAGNSGVTDTAIIPAGAAATFDQETKTALGSLFVGSATVTSDSQAIVATVEQAGTGSIKTLLGYNGFTGGATTVVAPLVMANNAGFFTGIQVQNVDGSTANVTVTYGPNTAGAFTPSADGPISVAAGASHTFLQSGGQWTGNTYVGSATITNAEGQELVAIVNQLLIGTLSFGTAYEGFDPSSATSSVSAPLVMANNGGYFTGIQVANTGGSSVNVTVTFGPNTAGAFTPSAEGPESIAAGASHTFLQSGGQWGSNTYVGSATITANGNIVAIVNELNLTLNDQFFTYNGFNY